MGSLYLRTLNGEERRGLEYKLFDIQRGRCFICEQPIDLDLHDGQLDIDHVEPTKLGGKDDPSNFALTHASCNRSKQASDLRLARIMSRFGRIRDEVAVQNRGPNLSDILKRACGDPQELPIRIEKRSVEFSFPSLNLPDLVRVPLYRDDLSGMSYFFANLPIEYLHHDDRINPRAVGSSLNGLIEEFHKQRPQLHVALAWIELEATTGKAKVHVFDGQHKLAAQVLLGVKAVPLRIFLNPNLDVLLTANTHAGTTLRQVAFDKSVQRHLGNTLYRDRIERYRRDRSLPEDAEQFSERDLVNHFRGEWREMRRYIIDAARDAITYDPENRLREYVDYGGKAKERPLSYSTVEKTFYSFFVYGDALDTPINYRLDENENPRQLEHDQILRLMNVIADTIYAGRFDLSLGTSRIENRVQLGEDIPEDHLRAFRLSKEEIIYVWLGFVKQIVRQYFIMQGQIVQEDRLFQYRFPEPLWENIQNFVRNLTRLPLWVNRELSLSVFGGKQNYVYWQKIFETGSTPQGQKILANDRGLSLIEMIQP